MSRRFSNTVTPALAIGRPDGSNTVPAITPPRCTGTMTLGTSPPATRSTIGSAASFNGGANPSFCAATW